MEVVVGKREFYIV